MSKILILLVCASAAFAESCYFRGFVYDEGKTVEDSCFQLNCTNGEWESTGKISSDCYRCSVAAQQFFETFDLMRYQWQGKCSYSLAQKRYPGDQPRNPEFAVYSEFDQCLLEESCRGQVSTLIDRYSHVVKYDHYNEVLTMNGVVQPPQDKPTFMTSETNEKTPILYWKYNDCYRVIGTQGLAIQLCYRDLYIWASVKLTEKLLGMCGNNNGNLDDDFTVRNGGVMLPQGHPLSVYAIDWQTAEQNNPGCPENENSQPYRAWDDCGGNKELTTYAGRQCYLAIETAFANYHAEASPSEQLVNIHINDCYRVACTFDSIDKINMWCSVAQYIFLRDLDIEVNTEDI